MATITTKTGYILLCAVGQPTVKVPVSSGDQASMAMQRYIHPDACTWLGASDLKRNCGMIYDAGNKRVARVSYNGRLWDLQGNLLQECSLCL